MLSEMTGLRRHARPLFSISAISLGIALTACESSQNSDTVPTATSGVPGATTSDSSSTTPTSASTSGSTSSAPTNNSSGGLTSTSEPTATTPTSSATSSSSTPTDASSSGESGATDGVSSAPDASSDGETNDASDPCASALLCDGFDDDVVGMAPGQPWKTEANGGAVAVSDARAFSGDKSVHVSNTQGQYKRAYFSVDGAPVFPPAGAELYGRLMMWVDKSPADGVHWTFIQGEGPSNDGSYDIFYRYGGQHQGKLMANFETEGVASDCWNHSATAMPTQTWTCLEWRFNTATDEMQFWLNGTEVADLHVVGQGNDGSGCVAQSWANLWPAPKQFEVLRLGLEKYQDDGPLDLWIDDVAIGASRLGCPSAQ